MLLFNLSALAGRAVRAPLQTRFASQSPGLSPSAPARARPHPQMRWGRVPGAAQAQVHWVRMT